MFAGRGDRTRGRLHAKRIRFRSSYRARPNVTIQQKIQSRIYGLFLLFYERALNAESFPRISL